MRIGMIVSIERLMNDSLDTVIKNVLSENNIVGYNSADQIEFIYSSIDFLERLFNVGKKFVSSMDKFILGKDMIIENDLKKDTYEFVDNIEDSFYDSPEVNDMYTDLIVILDIE